jgi:hypothetical protein
LSQIGKSCAAGWADPAFMLQRAISGIVVATNTLHNVQLKRLLTQDEVVRVKQKAGQLRSAYTPPSK